MSMKVTYPLPGGGKVEATVGNIDQMFLLQLKLGAIDDPKDAFKDATKAREGLTIPDVCPLDGTPVQLHHRVSKGYDFYEVRNTPKAGDPLFKLELGQYKESDGLFVKEREGWKWYSKEDKQEFTAFQFGHFIPDNFPPNWEPPAEQRALYPDGEYQSGEERESRPNRSRGSTHTKPSPAVDSDALIKAQNFVTKVGKEAGIPGDRIAAVVGSYLNFDNWRSLKDIQLEGARTLRDQYKHDAEELSKALSEMHTALADGGFWDADEPLEDEEFPF